VSSHQLTLVWVSAAAAARGLWSPYLAQRGLWADHPEFIVGVIAAIALQSALIAALLLNRRQRRQAEDALLVSEERYREVVESQRELVCRYLPDTTLTFVNGAYCQSFGESREALLGRRFLDLIPLEKHPEIVGIIRRVVECHSPILHEHEVLRPDGSVGWMEWQDFPIRNAQGELEELQGIGRDVTERRRATEALAEAERNLAHAARLALVGELTASIAHEINQPLGAILSNAEAGEMLVDSGSFDEVKQIFADIRADDLRASEVIQHVCGLVAKRTPQFAPVQINEVVEIAMDLAAREARRRTVNLHADLADELPLIEGERVQLKQVLLNLMLNSMDAMRATDPAHRQITVRTSCERGMFIEISVTDAGHGIASSELPRIFESFFTTKEMGMGLGLAMSRSIAEAHRGSITAENNAGCGATFRLRLPTNGYQIH
jgi:PAS domain S-box-containing protein